MARAEACRVVSLEATASSTKNALSSPSVISCRPPACTIQVSAILARVGATLGDRLGGHRAGPSPRP